MSQDQIDLARALGELTGKLDILILQLNEHIRKDEAAWERVTELEKRIIYVAGAASALVFFITSGIFAGLKKIGLV